MKKKQFQTIIFIALTIFCGVFCFFAGGFKWGTTECLQITSLVSFIVLAALAVTSIEGVWD